MFLIILLASCFFICINWLFFGFFGQKIADIENKSRSILDFGVAPATIITTVLFPLSIFATCYFIGLGFQLKLFDEYLS